MVSFSRYFTVCITYQLHLVLSHLHTLFLHGYTHMIYDVVRHTNIMTLACYGVFPCSYRLSCSCDLREAY